MNAPASSTGQWLAHVLCLALLPLALAVAPTSTAHAAPDVETRAAGTGCHTEHFVPRVVRVFDREKDVVIHRRAPNITLAPGRYESTYSRKARVRVRVKAGASYSSSGSIEASGLAKKALGKAEATFNLDLAVAGSATWATRSRVRINRTLVLRNSASFVFFRGIERVRGKYTYTTCVTEGDEPFFGHVERRRGRWVSWQDSDSGALRCGDPNSGLSNIAEAAKRQGCN
ncbi:hypothetical protein D0Z08_20850 [Nocardioides immobilis]|uniref:Uncharacterized protein n=1 Tax=Nocardioides immobilis TaxID=2049295 RepID=A0A417XX87_9ACTN|nr:hypothetical protein [Nocardioides immobilis]RHW25144.1 hypothetical protein D0Z08_20850 [Nocardioides immobilis]